ncbi:MAG TPA: MBL fold metallo-hydrolase [Gaiellaceae bacterium]|nr:MBL fold metallo-hydrolase [Gaiellaceae bacterium]
MFARGLEPALVAEGVVRLGTDLVGWFLVETEGRVVAVDAGLPGYRPQLEAGLAVLGRRPADLEAVVLTHSHGDHTGGAAALRRELGAAVHVHEAEAEAVRTAASIGKSEASQTPYLRHPHAWRLLAHFRECGSPEPVPEVEPFADGALLPGGLRAIHTDGHTPGHCVFHLESRGALFAGDLICTRNPLTGARGPELVPRPLNVSSAQMLASLDRLDGLEAPHLLVGHGPPWTGGLTAALARVRGVGPT